MTDKTTGTDLVKFDPNDSQFPILFDSDAGGLAEILEENFGDEGFQPGDLQRIKAPSGGAMFFDIPDADPVKEIVGVVVHRQKTRSYWIEALGEGESSNNPPDCASADGNLGNGLFGPGSQGNPSGECDRCPMNAFGSGEGDGKACKEQMQLFMLTPGDILPTQVTLPPTSLKSWRQYMARLTSKKKGYRSVLTKLSLTPAKSKKGISYAQIVSESAGDLAPEEEAAARVYGRELAASFTAALIAQAEANASNAAAGDSEPIDAEARDTEPTNGAQD